MKKALARYVSVAKGIVELLKPFVEVVIHDLESGTIAAIFNNFSGRQVGDSSHVDQDNEEWKHAPHTFHVYSKFGVEGSKVKSTTSVLKDDKGKPIGLFCINFDLTQVDTLRRVLDTFSTTTDLLPKSLFEEDWRERIHIFVHRYLVDNGLKLDSLEREQRQALVGDLYQSGAFEPKSAAEYIATVLKVSRATIYKDLATTGKL